MNYKLGTTEKTAFVHHFAMLSHCFLLLDCPVSSPSLSRFRVLHSPSSQSHIFVSPRLILDTQTADEETQTASDGLQTASLRTQAANEPFSSR